MVMDILQEMTGRTKFPDPIVMYDYTPEYWCGWTLALYQWCSGRSFKIIMSRISMNDLLNVYNPLHETPESKVVEIIESMIHSKETVTILQEKRKKVGMTQKRLSEESGVNLRTLQQYETSAKDINKASANTLRALSKVLWCRMEDLMEYPPMEPLD